MIERIKNIVSRRSLLEQLAEEAAELSKAALKLIRSEGLSENVTPVEEDEAFNNLMEEIEDLVLILATLDIRVDIIDPASNPKLNRWLARLKKTE